MKGKGMREDIFCGELECLTAEDPETSAKAFSSWGRDSEYQRLLDTDQAQLWSVNKIQKWNEKELEEEQHDEFFFHNVASFLA